jgi:hypothetical protein
MAIHSLEGSGMIGPEMLLQAALKAFVPKEVAERYIVQAAELSAIVEGMVKRGELDGIATLVSDVAEIKLSQARIEFGLARIYATFSVEQQFRAARENDRVPGSPGTGPCDLVAPKQQPRLIAGPGNGGDAGGQLNGVRGGDVGEVSSIGSEAAE